MKEKEVYILEESMRLFARYGVKSVSMDDIARQLGISKKTLYEYFANKKDLVKSVVKYLREISNNQFRSLNVDKSNAIDVLISVSNIMMERMRQITPVMNYDLCKYYPDAFKDDEEYKSKFVFERIIDNLQKGIKEGLYRSDIDTSIIASFYLIRLDYLLNSSMDSDLVKNLSSEKALRELLFYHIRGIATPKGIDYLENIIQKQKIK